MATSPPAGSATSEEGHRVSVIVLSQLPEPWSTIRIPNVPTTASVGELKRRIHNLVESHPAPLSQRLIYRGRVMMPDSKTLSEVIGEAAIQENADHTIHLVVSDVATQTHIPRSNTATPLQGQAPAPPAGGAGHFHGQAMNGAGMHTAPAQPATQQYLQLDQVPHYQYYNGNPQGQLIPGAGLPNHEINALIQQSMQQSMLLAQRMQLQADVLTQQMADIRTRDRLNLQRRNAPAGNAPVDAAESAAQTVGNAAQTVGNAAQTAGNVAQTAGNIAQTAENTAQTVEHESQDGRETSSRASSDTQVDSDHSAQPMYGPNFARSGIGPNGERWTYTTTGASSTTSEAADLPHGPPTFQPFHPTTSTPPFQGQPIYPGGLHPAGRDFRRVPSPIRMTPFIPTPRPARIAPADFHWLGPRHAVESMEMSQRLFDEEAAEYWSLRDRAGRESNNVAREELNERARSTYERIFAHVNYRNAAQAVLNRVLIEGTPAGHTALSAAQIAILRAATITFTSSASDFRREVERRQTASNNAASSAPGSSSTNESVTAWLLNGPQGPAAIVYHPQGIFTSAPNYRAPSHNPSFALPPSSVAGVYNPSRGSQQGAQPESSTTSTSAPFNAQQQQAHFGGGNNAMAANIQDVQQRIDAHRARIQQLIDRQRHNAAEFAQLEQMLGQLPHQQQQQAAADPVVANEPHLAGRAVAIDLGPLAQAAWLFIRVYGVMWLFLGGTGNAWFSWRMLALLFGSVLYWAVQAGVGRQYIDILQAYWDGLIGAGQVPAEAPEAAVGGANHVGPAPARPQDQTIAPPATEYAHTHTHQRPEAPRTAMTQAREVLRPIERTVALFFASLWPGVGERHVAETERVQREEQNRVRGLADAEAEAARLRSEGQTAAAQGGNDGQTASVPNNEAELNAANVDAKGKGKERAHDTNNETETDSVNSNAKGKGKEPADSVTDPQEGSSTSVAAPETDGLTKRGGTSVKDDQS